MSEYTKDHEPPFFGIDLDTCPCRSGKDYAFCHGTVKDAPFAVSDPITDAQLEMIRVELRRNAGHGGRWVKANRKRWRTRNWRRAARIVPTRGRGPGGAGRWGKLKTRFIEAGYLLP